MTRFLLSLLCLILMTPQVVGAHEHEGDGGSKKKSEEAASVTSLNDDMSLVQAGGGNILVLKGDEGLFVVDNGLADKSQTVMDAIKTVSDRPVKYLVNTHWHYDHSGNNKSFGENGTVLIAHDNVRKRLKEGGRIAAFDKAVKPAAKEALPVITYSDGLSVHLAGHQARVQKLNPAHTDGDSFIYFKKANVLHTGDIFFNGFFPFIDASSGGSVAGMVAAVDDILTVTNAQTKIIPGHGPMANEADLKAYQKMLKIVAGRLNKAKAEGITLEEWQKSKPLQDLNARWGGGFLNTDKFTTIVWDAV